MQYKQETRCNDLLVACVPTPRGSIDGSRNVMYYETSMVLLFPFSGTLCGEPSAIRCIPGAKE